MKPKALLSNFLGGVTLPHYLKKKEEPLGTITAEVVYDKKDPISVGDEVSVIDLAKNVRCFKVQSVEGVRKAKGDWSFRKETPMWATITAVHSGYYDDANEKVVPERLSV